MAKHFWRLTFLLFFWTAAPFAMTVDDLYQITVPTPSQSANDRAASMKAGIRQVLTKLTGDPQFEVLLQNTQFKPEDFVEEYSYSLAPKAAQPYLLNIKFNKDDLAHLLQKNSLPFWGENRPLLLIWLTVTDKRHANEIIGNEIPDVLLQQIKDMAEKHGLPIILPVLDMTDLAAISSSDINSFTLSKLQAASLRYASDAVLLGNIRQSNDEYQSEWQLNFAGNQWQWNFTADNYDNLLTTLFNQINQTLAKHFMIKSAESKTSWMNLEVSNILARQDLSQVMKYLKKINQVEKLKLSQINGDTVQLSLFIRGDLSTFKENIHLEHRLILRQQDVENGKLSYQWIG